MSARTSLSIWMMRANLSKRGASTLKIELDVLFNEGFALIVEEIVAIFGPDIGNHMNAGLL